MKTRNSFVKPASLTALAFASSMVFTSAMAQFDAVDCGFDSFSVGESLVFDEVWATSNDTNLDGGGGQVLTEQFFPSDSLRIIFGIQVNIPPGNPGAGATGCINSTIREVFPDAYYTGEGGNNPFGGGNNPLTLRVDWANNSCATRISVKTYENWNSANDQPFTTGEISSLTSSASLVPIKVARLEYTLFDIDVGGSAASNNGWDDVLTFNPAPNILRVPAGEDLNTNFTVTNGNATVDANIDNCTNTTDTTSGRYYPNCQFTVSWDGPLDSFEFTYTSGSGAQNNPVSQRIFISNVEFCEPAAPELLTTKVASPDPVRRGELLTYTLTVKHDNGSAASANNVVLSDRIPEGLTWIATEYPDGQFCNPSGLNNCACSQPFSGTRDVICEIGELERNETDSVVITTRVE